MALSFVVFFMAFPASSNANDILGFRVLSETQGDLTLEVRYYYSGNQVGDVYMSAFATANGRVAQYIGYNGKNCSSGNSIKEGRQKLCVNLSKVGAIKPSVTDGIEFCMYDKAQGKKFYCESFAQKKSWGSQQANSIAVAKIPSLAVVPGVTKIPAKAKQNVGRLSELTFSRLHIEPRPQNDRLQRLELHMSRSYRVDFTVVNNGDVTTPEFMVRTQCVRNGKVYKLGEKQVTKLPSGMSVQNSYNIFPSSAGLGDCVMQTVVDADNRVPEQDESASSNIMESRVLVVP
jgi:hypothetical protein